MDHGFTPSYMRRYQWEHWKYVAEYRYETWYGTYLLFNRAEWVRNANSGAEKPEPIQEFDTPEALWAYVELMQ